MCSNFDRAQLWIYLECKFNIIEDLRPPKRRAITVPSYQTIPDDEEIFWNMKARTDWLLRVRNTITHLPLSERERTVFMPFKSSVDE